MEVAEEHGGLRAGDHQDEEHQEQEAEHVIGLGGPDGVQNEEQLDEDAAEGQDTTHDDAWQGLCIHALFRNLPRDLVGADRILQGLEGRSIV